MSRRAFLDISLNGFNISDNLDRDTLSMTYVDADGEHADDITVTIQNRSKKWLYNWFPQEGDILKAKIVTEDWTGSLNCGEFVIDDVEMAGWPLTVNIRGVAMPVNNDFSEVPRSRTWQEASLEDIFSGLAGDAGIAFDYEAEYNPVLEFISQKDECDKALIFRQCEKYGLVMKMYSNKIIIYDKSDFEKIGAIATLTNTDLLSFRAKGTITNAGYTGCTVKYTDKDGQILEHTATVGGKTPKVYNHHIQVSNLAEAERVALAKLRELNMGETTYSCSIPGNTNMVTGASVNVAGFGNFNGKYLIDKAAHSVGGRYTTNLEMHRIAG